MARKPARVADAELAILDVLWGAGVRTARELTEQLYPRCGPADVATVQKLLVRLEEKGFVERDRSERVHQFRAAVPRAQFAAEQLSQLAEKLSGGSLTPLILHLVESRRLGRRELDEIRAFLQRESGR